MTKANYPCTQQELYMVCRLGWQSYQQQLPAFTDFKKKYDAPFAVARLAEVEAAANLPDFQTRDSVSESFRIELTGLAKKGLANWQKLKRYITDAWPPELQKPKNEAAGQNYYAKAGNEDWDACRGLFTSGSNFIADNLAALTAGDNMPETFQATFNTDKTNFENKQQEFLNSEEENQIGAENKLKANNEIYAKLIAMFLDGQEILKNEDAVLKQFVFEQVLNLVSGTGTAGIRGTITDSITGLPIGNATLQIEGAGKSVTTDEEGKFIATQVAAGQYKIIITAEGYTETIVSQTIKVGTISTLNVQLVKK